MNNELISVEIIPHEAQRYPTVGDWQFEPGGGLLVNISRLSNSKYMLLVAIHEIIEAFLCKADGITSEEVDLWDLAHLSDADPGGIQGCPYYRQHLVADQLDKRWSLSEKQQEILERIYADKT